MGGIKKQNIKMINPIIEIDISEHKMKITFPEFTEIIMKCMSEVFSITAEVLLDDRFLYSQYRHMWE